MKIPILLAGLEAIWCRQFLGFFRYCARYSRILLLDDALIFNENFAETQRVVMPNRVIVQDGSSMESAILILGLLQLHCALVLISRTRRFSVSDTFLRC
jgi:hypothetical protein